MTIRYTRKLLLCLAALALAAGCQHVVVDDPPDAEDLAQFPFDAQVLGSPAASGVRNWRTPFRPLDVEGSYLSVVSCADGQVEVWRNTWSDEGGPETRQLQVYRGPSLEKLGPPEAVCDGTIITDVFNPADPKTLAPKRGITRIDLTRDPEVGYVAFVCVCPDYLPGSVPLLPAILVSKTGEKGSWSYLGILPGEPKDEAAKQKIWSDGGSIIHLADGRWRVYFNGFGGRTMCAAESDTLKGPWKFLRDDAGGIRELLADFPRDKGRNGCFPQVLRVDDKNWHCWLVDKWPPQCVLHFWSADGLVWRSFGEQPEVTRAAFNGRPIKCLRPFLMPGGREIGCLLSVWEKIGEGKYWKPRVSEMSSDGLNTPRVR